MILDSYLSVDSFAIYCRMSSIHQINKECRDILEIRLINAIFKQQAVVINLCFCQIGGMAKYFLITHKPDGKNLLDFENQCRKGYRLML